MNSYSTHSRCVCSAALIRREIADEYGKWCWNWGTSFYKVQVFSFSKVHKLKYSFIVVSMTKVFKIIQLSDCDVTSIWQLSLHSILSYENILFIIRYLSSKIYCGILYMGSSMRSLPKNNDLDFISLFRIDEAFFLQILSTEGNHNSLTIQVI